MIESNREIAIKLAIRVLDVSRFKNMITTMLFENSNEVLQLFKLIFRMFPDELSPLLEDVLHQTDNLWTDCEFIHRNLWSHIDEQTMVYREQFHLVDTILDVLWTSKDNKYLSLLTTNALRKIFSIHFGCIENCYPRSFILRLLCDTNSSNDSKFFNEVNEKVSELDVMPESPM